MLPIVGAWRGVGDVSSAMRRNFGSLADQRADLLAVVAQGDTMVLFAEELGRVHATGEPYHVKWVQLFTLQDGKIARIRGVAASGPGRDGVPGKR